MEEYLKEILNEEEQKIIKTYYQRLVNCNVKEELALKIIDDIYQGYIGYCDYTKDSFELEELVKLLENNVTSHEDKFKRIQEIENNPEKENLITLNVSVSGFEDKIYRIIEIPSMYSLADLVYVILIAFKANDFHLYSVEYNNYFFQTKISCNNINDEIDENHLFTENFILEFMGIKKNDKMVINYDFKNYWLFNVEIINNEMIGKRNRKIQLLDGKGYGILENKKNTFETLINKEDSALNNYYDNLKSFNINYFDIDDCQKNIDEDFIIFKRKYEINNFITTNNIESVKYFNYENGIKDVWFICNSENNRPYVSYYSEPTDCKPTIDITDSLWNNFIKKFIKITSSWKQEYLSVNKDEEEKIWNVEITLKSGKKVNYKGKGKYPENFKRFLKIINKYIFKVVKRKKEK